MTVATLLASQDAQATVNPALQNGGGTVQNGTASAVAVGEFDTGCCGVGYTQVYMQMDLSSLPGSASISAASFTWTSSTAMGSNTAAAYLATAAWSEAGGGASPTFDTSNHTASLAGTAATNTSTDSHWLTWVQNWYSGATTNNGFVIALSSAVVVESLTINTRDATSNNPFLSVTYTIPPTPISSSDTGSGLEGTAHAGPDSSDTGSGLEGTPKVKLPDTDTGSGLEGTPGVKLTGLATDTGSGLEGTAHAGPRSSDTGSGLEGATPIKLADTDTGSGLEGTPALKLTGLATDTGSGLEGATPGIALTGLATDTGSGLEGTAHAGPDSSDTGSGLEGTPAINLADTDTGSGLEGTAHAGPDSSDTGSGLEGTPNVGPADSDTGSGLEGTPTIKLRSDVGLLDSMNGVEGTPNVGLHDNTGVGSGVDAGGVLVALFGDSDVVTTGWTNQVGGTTNLWSVLDELVASDADYVTATIS